MRLIAPSAFRSVLVWWADGVVDQHPRVVADVSPWWCGRASVGTPRVKAVWSKAAARDTTETITEKEKTP